MYDNHLFELLDTGKNSVLYSTIHEPKNLVVFVHGFGGKAVETWNYFNLIIKNSDEFLHTDVIYYGYESKKKQINTNALNFYFDFQTYIQLANGRAKNNTYKRIVLVGHSLGAIIIRRALLNAKVENRSWLSLCKMVLFAPAHWGCRNIQQLAMECLQGPLKIIGVVAQFIFPAINDLKEDSNVIRILVEDTKELLSKSEGDFTKAETVVWANDEYIVIHERFGSDPIALPVKNKNHISVCKPDIYLYNLPLEILLNALN